MKKIVLSMVAVASVAMAGGNFSLTKPIVKSSVENKSSGLADRVHFKGDMRLRYETIERDDKDNKYRTRYRLRLYTNIDVTDHLLFETAILSGKGNPTSGNVTFKDDKLWSDYFINTLKINILDFAYKFDNATLRIGKQAYMVYRPIKSQLIWDNDVRLEGINYNYKDNTKMFTVGANQIHRLENDAESTGDINLFLAQYVQSTKLNNAKLNIGAGIYHYTGLKGNVTPYGKGALGNTLDTNGFYSNDYTLLEGFAELKFKNVSGMPLKIAGSAVYNVAAEDNNFGYDIGIQLGHTKKAGDWKIKYSYTDIQEDAVFAAHSDSDNFGGGSAAKGHALRTKYKMAKNLELAGSFFFNTLYASKSKTDIEANYNRVQLDAIMKF